MSGLVVRPRDKDGERVWWVYTKEGSALFPRPTKREAVQVAYTRAEEDGYSHVLIHDTSDKLHDGWWNQKFSALTIEYNDDAQRWELWRPGDRLFGHNKKAEVVRVGKDKQDKHGFRYLKIKKKDGSMYWMRQHKDWRRIKRLG